jgi:15-hydroxyprostaglandin dehydrogenase (NAD)
MTTPVAIITGGASGIGLAVTQHLLSPPYSYKVVIADLVPASTGIPLAQSLGPNCLFHQTDVSVYAQQASLFAKAFEWEGGRLDFFAANAGIDNRESLYGGWC